MSQARLELDSPLQRKLEATTDKKVWWQSARAQWTAIISLAVAVAGLTVWWFFFHPFVSTDDARVAATLVRIAPEGVSGKVVRIAAQEGDRVKKGDVLVELDHRTAEAQLQRAKARAQLADKELRRITQLVLNKGLPARELDQAKANAESSEAEMKLAEIAFENTSVKSPSDGVVVQKTTEEGNIVEPGQTLMTLSDSDHAWIAANIEETSVGLVKVGQPVHVTIDEGGELIGTVLEIRKSVASEFALIPADSGAGNFTKVVQRDSH